MFVPFFALTGYLYVVKTGLCDSFLLDIVFVVNFRTSHSPMIKENEMKNHVYAIFYSLGTTQSFLLH